MRLFDLIEVGDYDAWIEQFGDRLAVMLAVRRHLQARIDHWRHERWYEEARRQQERERIAAIDRRLNQYRDDGERVPIFSREKVKELLTPPRPVQPMMYASCAVGTTMHYHHGGGFDAVIYPR